VPSAGDREVSLKRPLVTIDPDLVYSHPRLVCQLMEGRQVLAKADPQHPRAELAATGEPERKAWATPRRLRQRERQRLMTITGHLAKESQRHVPVPGIGPQDTWMRRTPRGKDVI
jgi:hypothetical protein